MLMLNAVRSSMNLQDADLGITTSKAFSLLVNSPAILEKEVQPEEPPPPPPPVRPRLDSHTTFSILELAENKVFEPPQQNNNTSKKNITADDATVETSALKNEGETDEEKEQVSPEEQAAVEKSTKFINMRDLLQLTFNKLLEEDFFLSLPVMLPAKRLTADGEHKDWVQWHALVHPSKLGHVLASIERIGVGTVAGNITVLPVELCRAAHHKEREEERLQRLKLEEQNADDSMSVNSNKAEPGTISMRKGSQMLEKLEESKEDQLLEQARSEWKNAATRLRIEQVREQIVEQAELSFDYLSLLSVSSILAGVGLITNNTVVIVASMLVSPIMGPVLGLTFGSRIFDWALVRSSLRNELLSLLGCVVWGGLIGVGSAFTSMAEDTFPTNEMEIRGEAVGLLTGIAIAIPSGMGVCLSVLGGNTSSLVGVAISASLLPPAVNTGICWAYAIFLSAGVVENDNGRSGADFAVLGIISFALTVVNIVCIWVAGLFMFEIKEVAPIEQKSAFWAKDIKVARELNTGKQRKDVDLTVVEEAIKKIHGDGMGSIGSKPSENINWREVNRHTMGGGSKTVNWREMNSHSTSGSKNINWREMNRHTMSASGNQNLFTLNRRRPQRHSSDPDLQPAEPAKDDVKYVGFEDVANLLGLQDEDGYIDPKDITSRLGHGHYL